MFTSHKQISPPSLVLKLKISEVSQKWIPKAVELKRIPTHKKCKCKKFCSQTRLVGEIYSSDVIMHRGYSAITEFWVLRSSQVARTMGYQNQTPTQTSLPPYRLKTLPLKNPANMNEPNNVHVSFKSANISQGAIVKPLVTDGNMCKKKKRGIQSQINASSKVKVKWQFRIKFLNFI